MKTETCLNRLLRLKQVKERVGLSKTTIYNMQSTGEFPRSVQLTKKSVAWKESDVMAWIASRPSELDKEGAPCQR
jgi:prophage regulatory protein